MPRKKSEKLKVLQGTARADRQRNTPKAKPIFPHHPPRGMIPQAASYARWFWKEHAGKLESLGLAREIDIPAFYVMCMTFETIRRCEDEIQRDGMTVDGARGNEKVKHPAISILNQARQQFRLQCQSFGLDPGSREKMDVTPDEPDYNDPMERLLSGPKDFE